MLTLYDFGNSVCCQKVRIAMRAKGLAWQAVNVDLFKAEQYDPEYLKLNPRGLVPTLVHDGMPVIESTLICEYVDEAFAQPPQLIPSDPWLKSRMRLWSKMVDEGLHEGVTEISFSAMFRERMKTCRRRYVRGVFATLATRAGRTVSDRPTSMARNRCSLCTASPLSSEPSRCWKIRSPKAAVRGFLALIPRWPTST